MGKKGAFVPLLPVPCFKVSPHRISAYVQFEGMQRKRDSIKNPYGAVTPVSEDISVDPNGWGFLEMLPYKPVYPSYSDEQIAYDRADIDKANEARQKHNNSIQNLLNNRPVVMSWAAQKRIIHAVNCFYMLSVQKPYEFVYGKKSGSKCGQIGRGVFRLNMLTLTLCAPQMHDDKYIKSKMLNLFLQRLRDQYNLKSYIWRAERQENGRIHFHITTNIYLPHAEMRKIWNEVQAKHGYIDAYKKCGGNGNPNGTDVHSVYKVRKLAAYICKYMAKGSDRNLAPIEGRQWFLSENLSKVQSIHLEGYSDATDELEMLVGDKWKKFDYASVAYVDMFTSDLSKYPNLDRLRKEWFAEYSPLIN